MSWQTLPPRKHAPTIHNRQILSQILRQIHRHIHIVDARERRQAHQPARPPQLPQQTATHVIPNGNNRLFALYCIYCSVPELANLGRKQHPLDIVFPLFPFNFTNHYEFPLSTWQFIHLLQLRGKGDPVNRYILQFIDILSIVTGSMTQSLFSLSFSHCMPISKMNFPLLLHIVRLNFSLPTLASKQS